MSKPTARLFAKIASGCPTSVAFSIYDHCIIGYGRGQLEPLVDTMRYLSPLALDCITAETLVQVGWAEGICVCGLWG